MKNTSEEICAQLGIDEKDIKWDAIFEKDETIAGNTVTKGRILFPRLEIDKEVLELEEANNKYMQLL
jgi:methionyl-tRNA synthetase